MAQDQYVFGIRWESDGEGNIVNAAQTVAGAVSQAAIAASKSTAQFNLPPQFTTAAQNFQTLFNALGKPFEAKGIEGTLDRLQKRLWGVQDRLERVNVAKKQFDMARDVNRGPTAEELRAKEALLMDTATNPASTQAAQQEAQAELKIVQQKLAQQQALEDRTARYLYNAEINLSRATYEYRIDLLNKFLNMEKKAAGESNAANNRFAGAQNKAQSYGLSAGQGAESAQKVLGILKTLDQSIFSVSDKIRRNLPPAVAAAMDEMAQKEKQGMEASLQNVLQNAQQKKQAVVQATDEMAQAWQALQQAEAAAAANPADQQAQAGLAAAQQMYQNKSTAAKNAAADAIEADTKAFEVSSGFMNQLSGMISQKSGEQTKQAKAVEAAWSSSMSKIGTGINQLGRAFNAFTQAGNKIMNAFRLVGQGFNTILQTFAFSIAAPLAYFIKEGFTYAVEFEQQMAKVKKAVELGSTGATYGYKELEGMLRRLSDITPTTSVQLAKFAEQAGQVGVVGVPAIYRWVNLMNKMAVATDVDANSITTDMGEIANSLGWNKSSEKGIDNLERLASVMDLVAKKTSTNVAGIVAAMKDIASVGPQLNIAAKDLAAMVGVLISSGVDSSAAGTVLSRFFLQITKNAQGFTDMMANVSRDVTDANGKVVSSFKPYTSVNETLKQLSTHPVEVLIDALKQLEETTDESKAAKLREFIDATGLVGGKVGAMAKNYSELKSMLQQVNDEWDSQSTLQKDYNEMLGTTDASMKIFQNNLNDLGVTMAQAVMPVFNQILYYAIPVIQDLMKQFSALDPKMQMIIVAAPVLVVALTPLLIVFSSLIQGLSMLGMAIFTVIGGIGSFVFGIIQLALGLGNFLLGIGGIVEAIGGLIEGFAAFGTVIGAMVEFVSAAFGAIVAVLGAVAEGFIGVVSAIGAFLSGIGEVLLIIAAVIAAVIAMIAAILGSVYLFSRVYKNLGDFGQWIADFWIGLGKKMAEWGEAITKAFAGGILDGLKYVGQAISYIGNMIADWFEAHSPPRKGPLHTIDKWGKNLMTTFLKGFSTADFDILKGIANTVKGLLDSIGKNKDWGDVKIAKMFLQARHAIAAAIAEFNKTGDVSEATLNKITKGLGPMGPEVKKLVQYWLAYQKIQKEIKDNEQKQKDSKKNYEAQVNAINARTDISAEEKARLIRQAMMGHDKEMNALSKEHDALEEQADAAKDKLDQQQAYIDAQQDELDALNAIKDAIKAANDEKKQGEGSGGIGDNVKQQVKDYLDQLDKVKEEWNKISDNIAIAKGKMDDFWSGFMGESWQDKNRNKKHDHEGPAAPSDAYTMGVKVRDIWNEIVGILKIFGIDLDAAPGKISGQKDPLIEIRDTLRDVKDNLQKAKDTFDQIGATIKGLFTPLVVLYLLLQAIWNMPGNIWKGITDSFDDVQKNLTAENIKKALEDIVTGAVKAFVGNDQLSKQYANDILKMLFPAIFNGGGGKGAGHQSLAVPLQMKIRNILDGAVQGAKSWFTEHAPDWVQGFIDWVKEIPKGFVDLVKNVTTELDKLVAAATGFPQWFTSNLPKWTEQFTSWVNNIPEGFANLVSNVRTELDKLLATTTGFPNWFSTNLSKWTEQFSTWVNNIPEGMKNLASTVVGELPKIFTGGNGKTGLNQWFIDNVTALKNAIAGWIKDGATGGVSGIGDAIIAGFNAAKDGADGVIQRIGQWFASLSSGIVAWLNNNGYPLLAKIAEAILKGSGGGGTGPTFAPADNPPPSNKKKGRYAQGGIVTAPTLAMIGEGGESEIVAPLSKLPSLFDQLYGGTSLQAAGGGMTVIVNNPVVREEKDIQKIADAVKASIEKQVAKERRYRGGI